MFRALTALAAAVSLGLPGAAAPASGAELERVVAVVRSPGAAEPSVITLTNVEEEARIALVYRGALLAAAQPLDGPALKAGLEWLVDQLLLNEEASRLQVFEIDRAEGLAELARFRARFVRPADYQAFLARCDLSEPELEAVLRRMLRVKRYVESRISQASHVREADLTALLDKNATEAGSRDREAARAHLARERMTEEAKALVRDLRSRAQVRVFEDLAIRAPSGARPREVTRPGSED
jgi:hypothetical protein